MTDYVNQVVDIGAAANDGNGDPIRTGFTKLNDNWFSFRQVVSWDTTAERMRISSAAGKTLLTNENDILNLGRQAVVGSISLSYASEVDPTLDDVWLSTNASGIHKPILILGRDGFEIWSPDGSSVVTVGNDISAVKRLVINNSGKAIFEDVVRVSGTNSDVVSGSGSPEGVVTANPGSLYMNNSGGANVSIYVKESGTGNTGWVAK